MCSNNKTELYLTGNHGLEMAQADMETSEDGHYVEGAGEMKVTTFERDGKTIYGEL